MALRNVLKLKCSSLASTIHLKHQLQHVTVNLLCATTPIKAAASSSQNLSYTQIRFYRKRIDVSHLKPLNFDYAGDLEKQKELDLTELQFKFRGIPEINELPPHVRRMFTVEYASGRERLEHRNAVLQDKVVSLAGPMANYERQVAYMTLKIRNMVPCIVADRRNKKHKAYLIERIAKRRKILGYIRRLDYDRFIWLLKELKLTYTAPAKYEYYKPHKRALLKQSIREDYFAAMKTKIESAKDAIEKEKEKFHVEKENVLRDIEDEAEKYGISKEEVLELYEKNLVLKRKEKNKPPPKQPTGWKRLNEFIKQDEIRKEKEKWVF